jgi:1,4-alpha-glucan branching enzyme
MYRRSFTTITLLFLLAGCAPKSPAPEVFDTGVRFSFYAPSAKSVTIAGGFNRWNPEQHRLTGPDKNGIWTIFLPLSMGRYEYHFVIDRTEWVLDPAAPSVDDGLDGKNSLVIVPR